MNHSPTSPDAVAAILGFLALFQGEERGDVAALEHALDALVAAYHRTEGVRGFAPMRSEAIRSLGYAERASMRFGHLDDYADVDPRGGTGQAVARRTAPGDLAAIALALTEVLWALDNRGGPEAVALFRAGYRDAWGAPLHAVRRYLHAVGR